MNEDIIKNLGLPSLPSIKTPSTPDNEPQPEQKNKGIPVKFTGEQHPKGYEICVLCERNVPDEIIPANTVGELLSEDGYLTVAFNTGRRAIAIKGQSVLSVKGFLD